MKSLVLFNVDFCSWPVLVCEALQKKQPDLKIEGVVTVDHTVTRFVAGQDIMPVKPLHCLSKLEDSWLQTLDAAGRLAHFEKLLGTDALAQIAISDRELSAGWVHGGTTALTPLRHQTANNEFWQAYLAGLIGFFYELFEAGDFDFVLSYPVQDAPSVTAGLMAAHFNVPFLSPKPIGFQTLTCLFDDVRTMSPCFAGLFHKAANERLAIAPQFWQRAEQALVDFRARPKGPDYMSVANKSAYERPGLLDTASLLYRTVTRRQPESLRYPYPFSRLTWEYGRWLKSLRDRNGSQFHQLDQLTRPYVYFPLHYEPEASTLVSAPEYTNQVALIEEIAKAIPTHWQLAVKEHLPMLGRRPGGYYQRLAAIPKTVLISPHANGFAVQERARLTVTITGTAGLEAVFLQRPVVFVGPSPVHILNNGYVFAPQRHELSTAIAKAIDSPSAEDEELIRFLAALFARSIELPASEVWGGTSVITPQRVRAQQPLTDRLADLILDAIDTGN